MTAHEFKNMLLSLRCIDGYQLPELTEAEQEAFCADPIVYFFEAGPEQSDAIMREVMKRNSFLRRTDRY